MNPERLYKAVQFASKAHDGQKRKGKSPAPYIAHPVFVGMELLRLGCDEDTVIAGFLHDTLEDTHLSRDAIKREFGENVLNLVQAVTEPKDPNMSKEEKKRTWESRKEAYLERLKSSSVEARAVACADMWANMLELKQTLKEEGSDALKLFNVDMGKKLKHWKKELDLLAEVKDSPHSEILPDVRNMLIELDRSLNKK